MAARAETEEEYLRMDREVRREGDNPS